MATLTSYDHGKCKHNEAGEVCRCQEWDPSEANELLCECCMHHMSFHEPFHPSLEHGRCLKKGSPHEDGCQEFFPGALNSKVCVGCGCHRSWHEKVVVPARGQLFGPSNVRSQQESLIQASSNKCELDLAIISRNVDDNEEAVGIRAGVDMECKNGVPEGCGTIGVNPGLQHGRGVEDGNANTRNHLEPKHKVFLSHSGSQKSFVEQLCVDLERTDRYPFFDKRWDSLPVGKKFPKLLFSAIQQCEVGVVVFSKEFFTHSKWPMLELVEMVRVSEELKCGMDIVPIFYNISREECRDDETQRGWKKKWEEWAASDLSINMDKWMKALKIFGSTTGLVLRNPREEVQLRVEVVEAVCTLVLPESRPDDLDVEGKDRLCKIILDKIESNPQDSSVGVRIVGLYGIGGIGKTTICKVLFNKSFKGYRGKVCHIELKSKSKLELFQELLKTLTNTRHDLLDKMDIAKCQDQMRRCIVKQPIFLAIDNVDEESSSEAKTYLEAIHSFANGSVVVVTSRSLDHLKALNILEDDCLGMPELERTEARKLFISCVTSIFGTEIKLEERMIDLCVGACCFRKGDGLNHHYHPLALKVLGNVLREEMGRHGFDLEQWDAKVSKIGESPELLEAKKEIFSILRISYDMLSLGDQMLLMDVALFVRPNSYILDESAHKRRDPIPNSYILDESAHKRRDPIPNSILCVESFDIHMGPLPKSYIYDESFDIRKGPNLFEWLSTIHDLKNLDAIKAQLEYLKKKSLLESVGDGSTNVGLHDLWREFCIAEIEVEDFANRRCVYDEQKCKGLGESSPSGRCWEKLERMCFISIAGLQKFLGLNLDHFANLKVLKVLVYMKVNNLTEVDLGKLPHLKHLELGDICKAFTVGGLRSLSNLAYLEWFRMPDVEVYAEDIGFLTSLQFLRLPCSKAQRLPDMSKLTALRVAFFVECEQVKVIMGLSSKLTSLRSLKLNSCLSLRSCPGLDDVISLETVDLSYCGALEELPNLERLTNLKELMMPGCSSLSVCHLQQMDDSERTKLRTLPFSGDLVSLVDLKLEGCRSLACLTSTKTLRSLKRLDLSGCESMDMLDLSPFPQLEELELGYCLSFTSLRCGASLLALKKLYLGGCEQLKGLPDLCKFVNVEVLNLSRCSRLVCLTSTKTLHSLKSLNLYYCKSMDMLDLSPFLQLGVLELGSCSSLTSLRCGAPLLALKKLHLGGLEQLKELPDLCSLVNLEVLNLSGCTSLACLTSTETLHSLKSLNLYCCWSMDMLDLSPFVRLEYLELGSCSSLTSLRCGAPLLALKKLHLGGLEQLKELPDLCSLVNLEVLNLSGCTSLACLTSTETLYSLKSLNLHWCKSMDMLDLSRFPQLEDVELGSCSSLTSLRCSVPSLALTNLNLCGCEQLNGLPDLCKFVNVEVLNLSGCSSLVCLTSTETLHSLKSLDLYRCKSMDMLDLSRFPRLEELKLGSCLSLTSVRCGASLLALTNLNLGGCKQLNGLPDLCKFVNVEVLNLSGCSSLVCLTSTETLHSLKSLDLYRCGGMDMLDLSPFPQLEELKLGSCLSLTSLRCGASLLALKKLYLGRCEQLIGLPDLCKFVNVEVLNLSGCTSLACLMSTETLYSLKSLDLYRCRDMDMLDLSCFPRLEELKLGSCLSLTSLTCGASLLALTNLNLGGCKQLNGLPDLCKFVNVEVLNLSGCSSLVCLTSTETLYNLKSLDLYRCGGMDMLDLSRFPRLKELKLGSCLSLTSLRCGASLLALTNLNLGGCEQLIGLPDLCNFVNVEVLNLSGCSSLVYLTSTEILYSLKSLDLYRCGGMDMLDLSRFPRLEELKLGSCLSLTSLTCGASLLALKKLYLGGCKRLEGLPDLCKFVNLEVLFLSGCSSLVFLTSTKTLHSLKSLHLYHCGSVEMLELSPFPQLEELILGRCLRLRKLSCDVPLRALKKLDLAGCEQLKPLPDLRYFMNL